MIRKNFVVSLKNDKGQIISFQIVRDVAEFKFVMQGYIDLAKSIKNVFGINCRIYCDNSIIRGRV